MNTRFARGRVPIFSESLSRVRFSFALPLVSFSYYRHGTQQLLFLLSCAPSAATTRFTQFFHRDLHRRLTIYTTIQLRTVPVGISRVYKMALPRRGEHNRSVRLPSFSLCACLLNLGSHLVEQWNRCLHTVVHLLPYRTRRTKSRRKDCV